MLVTLEKERPRKPLLKKGVSERFYDLKEKDVMGDVNMVASLSPDEKSRTKMHNFIKEMAPRYTVYGVYFRNFVEVHKFGSNGNLSGIVNPILFMPPYNV